MLGNLHGSFDKQALFRALNLPSGCDLLRVHLQLDVRLVRYIAEDALHATFDVNNDCLVHRPDV